MASKDLIVKVLNAFLDLSNRTLSEEAEERLASSYMAAFQNIHDSDLQEVCATYMKEGKFFPPRPSELMELLPKVPVAEKPTGDFRIRENIQCSRCRRFKTCIQEPAFGGTILCKECYTGMTIEQIQRNFDLLSKANKKQGITVWYNEKTRQVRVRKEVRKNCTPEYNEVVPVDTIEINPLDEILEGDTPWGDDNGN